LRLFLLAARQSSCKHGFALAPQRRLLVRREITFGTQRHGKLSSAYQQFYFVLKIQAFVLEKSYFWELFNSKTMDTIIATSIIDRISYTFNLITIIERDDGKKKQVLAY
jgi:hypothetical protein